MQKYLIFLLAYFIILSGHTIAQPKLIGTNTVGGNGYGTIYKYNAGDTVLSDIIKFSNIPNLSPNSLTKHGSVFYGTCTGCGDGSGSIVKYNPVNKKFSTAYYFSRGSEYAPLTKLLLASNGNLYGSTKLGGPHDGGNIYEFNPLTETYTNIFDCNPGAGTGISSSLIQATNGKIYASTSNDGANGTGTILELDLSTLSIVKIHDFDSSFSEPLIANFTELVDIGNGKLIGISWRGGVNNQGIIFEFDISAQSLLKKFDFGGLNGYNAKIIKATNSKILGTTRSGGANSEGVIFQYDFISNLFTKLFDFGGSAGEIPNSELLKLPNGKYLGTTNVGGVNNNGVLFEYDLISNNYQVLIDFDDSIGYHPQLYASDNIGNYWVNVESGVYTYLFKYNAQSGTFSKEIKCTFPGGYRIPGSFVLAENGKYYGGARAGGKFNRGTILEFDYNSNTITDQVNLNDSLGYDIHGNLILDSNGKIYGSAADGGQYYLGVLFEYDYINNLYEIKHHFQYSDGLVQFNTPSPAGLPIIKAINGKIYGMRNYGGINGLGTLYEYDIASGIFEVKLHFNGVNGEHPDGGFIQASNGMLYAVLSKGGPTSSGCIIEFNPSTDSLIVKKDLIGSGLLPTNGNLIEIAPNKLYGLSILGGQYNGGALYDFDCISNQITILHSFLPSDLPYGSLLYASNGKLYGLTTVGTTDDLGGIFEYEISTNTYSHKIDWLGINAGWKPGLMLQEVGCIAPGILASGPVSFCQGDSVILSAFGSNSNSFQWHRNGNPIAGANNQNYTVKLPGKYSVSVTDTTCSLLFTSNPVRVRIPCLPPFDNQDKLSSTFTDADIFLNYDSQQQQFEIIATDLTADTYNLLIADATGRILINENSRISNNSISRYIDCSAFAKGLYIVKIVAGDKILSRKFVKER